MRQLVGSATIKLRLCVNIRLRRAPAIMYPWRHSASSLARTIGPGCFAAPTDRAAAANGLAPLREKAFRYAAHLASPAIAIRQLRPLKVQKSTVSVHYRFDEPYPKGLIQ